MSRYRLLIFDWDGTLIDSAGRIVACLQAAIEEAGLPPREESQLRYIIGLGLQEACAHLYPEHDLRGEPMERLARGYRHHWFTHTATPQRLFPDVAHMLERLESRGHWLAVATGKSRAGLDTSLRETGLDHRFHSTRTADETASKPDPLMLRELLAELDTPADEALMIGDTEFDLRMAEAAGVDSVAVTCGAHPAASLQALGPRTMLARPADLLSWLDDPAGGASAA